MARAVDILVIKSSEWLRNSLEGYNTKFYTSGLCVEGRYCCLGLDARREGVEDRHLQNYGTPYSVLEWAPSAYRNRWLTFQWANRNEVYEATEINDNPDTTDEEKIALLRPIFAEVGVEIDWRPNE